MDCEEIVRTSQAVAGDLQQDDLRLQVGGRTIESTDWRNDPESCRRFQLMLDVIREQDGTPLVLCDLGCGTGELLSYIKQKHLTHIRYIGIDRSPIALEIARRMHPEAKFEEADVLAPDAELDDLTADYIILNGMFTVRGELSTAQMQGQLTEIIARIWPLARRGIAFNVVSVDPAPDGLFHLPIDQTARLLHGLAGQDIVVRADYGLGEYTAYAYRVPANAAAAGGGNALAVGVPGAAESDVAEVPVLRPLTATSERIAPYLKRIDASRIYSNFGPLVLELGDRLCDLVGLPSGGLVGASSGTTALTATILAQAGRATTRRPLAVVPSFTFGATALAVELCGYELLLADADAESWMLEPTALRDHPDLDRIGLVVPVAPFGRHIPQSPWQSFHHDTGIPVVIDAAACFEDLVRRKSEDTGLLPTVLSFHATKSYSTGEGGAVLCRDPARVLGVAQTLSFGFRGDRACYGPGINGKMSEYHAAVGLADLDMWPNKAAAFAGVVRTYEDAFDRRGLSSRLVRAPDIASCYMLLPCQDVHEANSVTVCLAADGIAHRRWYGAGLHMQPHFRSRQRDALPVTEDLTTRLIGLPAGPTLSPIQVERVASAVARGLQQ